MTNEEILANAPEGATHCAFNTYYKREKHKWWHYDYTKKAWFASLSVISVRNLDDIRKIVEQQKEIKRLMAIVNDCDCGRYRLEA